MFPLDASESLMIFALMMLRFAVPLLVIFLLSAIAQRFQQVEV
jgi:hypothetical protein